MIHRWKFVTRVAVVVVATVLVACSDLAGINGAREDVASLTGSNGSDTSGGTGPDTGATNPDTVISDTSTVPDTTHPDTTFRGRYRGSWTMPDDSALLRLVRRIDRTAGRSDTTSPEW